jgi:NodT family efflux transporter outer membrane factor (OMF) lipoprotein
MPASFEQRASATAPLWPSQTWWVGFGDPQLNALIARAQSDNLDIYQAAARLRQADARARAAGAALLPTVNATATSTTFYGHTGSASDHETDYGVSVGISYDLDFWGKNRDIVNAARAAQRASDADRATVALGVTASVAASYFQLLSLRDRIDIARANLGASEAVLRVIQRRVDAGYAANADLTQQRALVAAQRAIIPALEQQALEARTALALLLGVEPEGFEIAPTHLDQLSAPEVRPGLPSELLTRRPDIVRAESELLAAHADLSVARKAFLPDLSLTANGGVAYPALAAAVDTLPGFGLAVNGGATLIQTIFDGGARHARIEESSAHEQELLAAYRAAVIASFSDVENALGDTAHLGQQEAEIQSQVVESERVLRSAQRKYTAGAADFLVVTDAQRSLYAARDQLADTHRAYLTSVVTLFKALGGGWTEPADAASPATADATRVRDRDAGPPREVTSR